MEWQEPLKRSAWKYFFAWYPNLITIKYPEFADPRNVSKQIFSRWTRINRDVIGRTASMGNIPKWTNFSGWWISRNQPHTRMHAYIHTYRHPYMFACIHTCIHTCMHAYIHSHTYIRCYVATLHTLHYYIICMLHAYPDTYLRTYVRTHTQTYEHTSIHAYKHTFVLIYIHYYITTLIHYYIFTLLHYYVTTLLHYMHAFMHTYIRTLHTFHSMHYIHKLHYHVLYHVHYIIYITYILIGCSSTTFLEGLFGAYISLCVTSIFFTLCYLKKKTSWYKLYLYQATRSIPAE